LRYQWTREVIEKKKSKGQRRWLRIEGRIGFKFHKHAKETHLMEEDDPDAYPRM